ncbi:MAG TPA: chitosanase [Pilimelia sp.]|nr:chitosanase [Pilimelia sp.]
MAAAAILAASVPVTLLVTAGTATEILLSQGRPTLASSVETPALGAANAVDGDPGSRWASTEGADPQWIQVDLGARHRISRVVLTWEAAHAQAYAIQTSTDGAAWSTVFSTASADGGTDEVTGQTTPVRYLRMYAIGRGTARGYSLWEMRVYGSPAPDPTTPGPTPTAASPAATPAAPTPTSPTPTPTPTARPRPPAPPPAARVDLTDPRKKDIAMRLVSSAENSSLDWRAQYEYIEDIGDGRGYTAGIIGFCSGTGDMRELVAEYTRRKPGNVLAKYQTALREVDGSDSHAGLDPGFPTDWRTAARDPVFQAAQNHERDRVYFNPAVRQAKADGLRALGQFAYYDAIVMHGGGTDPASFGAIRRNAMRRAKTPAQGGSEVAYLNAFLDARAAAMRTEAAHSDTSRVDTAQRVFLRAGNLDLNTPLSWKVYGDPYTIR